MFWYSSKNNTWDLDFLTSSGVRYFRIILEFSSLSCRVLLRGLSVSSRDSGLEPGLTRDCGSDSGMDCGLRIGSDIRCFWELGRFQDILLFSVFPEIIRQLLKLKSVLHFINTLYPCFTFTPSLIHVIQHWYVYIFVYHKNFWKT